MIDRSKNYYEIFEVKNDADIAAIRQAWLRLVKIFHPEVKDTGDIDSFNYVNEIFDILLNPEQRAAYDLTLKNEPD